MLNKNPDIISSISMIALAFLYILGTRFFVESSVVSSGAKLLPYTYATILFLASFRILYKSLKKHYFQSEKTCLKATAAPQDSANYRKVVLTLFLIALYTIMFQHLGFVTSTFIYLILQMFTLSDKAERNSKTATVVAAIATVCLYYLFTHAFLVAFPVGILF